MLKIDVNLSNHIFVEHNIESDEQFASELVNALDLIVSDRVKSKRDLSIEENIKKALQYRNHILQMMKETSFCCPECYEDAGLIQYEK